MARDSGLLQNPPVTIEDWPEPDLDIYDNEDGLADELPADDPNRDPEFMEEEFQPRLDPILEPRLTAEEMCQILDLHLGDLAEDEWMDMYSRHITNKDRNTLKILATRLRTHFSRQTWDDLRLGVCKDLNIPSEFIAWWCLKILSGLETSEYNCCINSCCCFLGKYKDMGRCPFCQADRYNTRGQARRSFHYTPLIPQLCGLFQSRGMASKLQYRVQAEQRHDPSVMEDVFDGANYRSLRQTQLCPNHEYRLFDNLEDIALGFSTDGLSLFQRRRRGYSTAWPLIFINYNLHPGICTCLENVLCVGIIPGPRQCKDLNSFLIPLLKELLDLEDGVETTGLSPEVPNMIKHWTGKFKGLDKGWGNYKISEENWNIVGQLTTQATRTIPSAFVGTIPNIASDGGLFKAEAHVFWIQYLAPILLHDVLPAQYYHHLLLLREIVLRCLQLQITSAQIDGLKVMVNQWITQYEEYCYQFNAMRLPTCPLTIHALVHLPYYIRRTGPLWASWVFVMERFCGSLLPAVLNRVRPYEHLDNYVQRRAQMQIVSKVYNLPSLAKPYVHLRYENGVEMSSRKTGYPEFPDIVLGAPVNKRIPLDTQLLNQLTWYFGIVYHGELRERINRDSVDRYGRFHITGDGDRICTANLIDNDPIAQDNSYIKYDLLPDGNAAYRNREDIPFHETQYGRVLDV
ncbi:hypothetical protein FRC10_002754 [Ceratobasidium sp. 414]|nr:hypothetical protein FRC10_002754 [Ceratobasidium sp. 414]